MRTTQDYEAPQGPDYGRYEGGADVRGLGWLGFAAIMLGLAGAWNILAGIMAIGSANVFVDDARYIFSDLNTWGWIVLALGIAQVVAAFAVIDGSAAARWFGIACAGVNALGQLAFMPAYPGWTIAIFAIDVLIVYALAVYGGARARPA